ncbi:MAG: phosphoglucomutase, alpha-D-glucose phosphate-specific [Desulfovibrio sp.]|jgi:phosphoglucomutase|nr:phosphoglucomutase, alpha-D-glucose phosphate-specific [Desulfovibrio sp.]
MRKLTLDGITAAYYDIRPDAENPAQRVSFGTSGHRGASLDGSFTEWHVLAITQALCDYRKTRGITGPLFMGRDTHALSVPAMETALSVLAANGVRTRVQAGDLPTPTPVISHAVLRHNASGGDSADGIVVTPSHNPPEDGGFKYNEPHGGPAGAEVTAWIEKRANEYLASGNRGVSRLDEKAARKHACVSETDYIRPYVRDLENIVDLEAVAASGLRLGVDPLGGSSLPFWEPIAETYGLNLKVVNICLDPLFSFMPPDHDGKIRMDCSSPFAMAGLISLSSDFDLAFGNDPDADRHGIVTPKGLMNSNHYLCAAVWHLLQEDGARRKGAGVGKTCVSTSLIDRICADQGAALYETPVGFKWFVDGLLSGRLFFGGEESAGASFLRKDGKPWSTDKDGIAMNLLAAEMTAKHGKNPAEIYAGITGRFGETFFARRDVAASKAEKKILGALKPQSVTRKELAGDPITRILTRAPGNDVPIGGIKVETARGWFAARPSGTEDMYKVYAESFADGAHLRLLQEDAGELVSAAFASLS